jgi:TM2 domain-containing membrane protein YozV
MLNQREVDAEEERLRALAAALPEARRKTFYEEAKRKLRDPDTYAVLNWFCLAGLHHFYLGKWGWGLLNLAVFAAGIVLMVVYSVWLGCALILLVTAWELWALFRAQSIVQDRNNRLYRDLLRRHGDGR